MYIEENNLTIFDCLYDEYKITKPIRLIELFGGVGSQAMALRNIGANFEHYRLVEWDKFPVASYNAIHNTNFEPTDITKIHSTDLGIVDTQKYEYIITYSFPCQDLSLAGLGKGMKKGSGTRSGLLWEVERLLNECKELPQVLLMENVPEVIGQKNIKDFQNWQYFLESKGYSNYVQVLNAKDYGIPQNRRRCFMVSILGDFNYTFPKKQKLKLKLKDMLEDAVDEKFYLSNKMIDYMKGVNANNNFNRAEVFERNLVNANIKGIAATITTCAGQRPTDNFILGPEATKKGFAEASEGDGIYINRPHQKRGVVQKEMIQTLKTSCADVGVVVKDANMPRLVGGIGEKKSNNGSQYYQQDRVYDANCIAMCHPANLPNGSYMYQLSDLRIRKLTPKECWRLMGFKDEDYEKASKVNSNAQLYKQAGNSIVVNVLEAIFKQLF